MTALRGIVANRMRAFLSTVGIAIGVATLMTIYGLVSGLTTSFTTQIAALGSNTMYVTSRPWVIRGDWWEYRNRPPITRARRRGAPAWRVAPRRGRAAGVRGRRGLVSQRRGSARCRCTAPRASISTPRRSSSISGRFLSAVEGASVEPGRRSSAPRWSSGCSRQRISARRTDPARAEPVHGDRRAQAAGQGVRPFARQRRDHPDRGVRQDLRSAAQHGASSRRAAPDHLYEAEDQIIEVLRRSRGLGPETADTFSVNRQSELVKIFDDETSALFGVAIAIGLITLLVGGIGVMNIMLVAVTERTREIGVRRALGARRRTILMQFLVESALVTMVGGSIGTGLGVVASAVIDRDLADRRRAVVDGDRRCHRVLCDRRARVRHVAGVARRRPRPDRVAEVRVIRVPIR